jgi:hypothetical protein
MRQKSRSHKNRPTFDSLETRELMAVFMVTDTAPTGPGSLAAAIVAANKQRGTNAIDFNIPGTGDHSVQRPKDGLPAITSSVEIDGYSQPGSAPNTSPNPAVNNAVITINLNATEQGQTLLTVRGPGASGTLIQGINFTNESQAGTLKGLDLKNASLVTVNGCSFSSVGQSRLAQAVLIDGGSRDTIGGTIDGDPELQNVMSGYTDGVTVQNSSNDAIVYNLVGGEPPQSRSPFQQVGIWLTRTAKNNTIVNNYLYKNLVAIRDHGTGNFDSGNITVPRS